MLHMTAGAASMVCALGSRSRRSLPGAMATRGGRISTPASQALREASMGASEGSVGRGRSEAHVTVWWAPLMKRPTLPAPGGPGATTYSRLGAEDTPSRNNGRGFSPLHSRRRPWPACGS